MAFNLDTTHCVSPHTHPGPSRKQYCHSKSTLVTVLGKQENENATRRGKTNIFSLSFSPIPLFRMKRGGGRKNTIYGIGPGLNLEKYEDLKKKKKIENGSPGKIRL